MTPDAQTIPVEIQLVAIGNAETVEKINQVSNAAKRAGSEGFGSLEHFLIRASGGNRELMLGLRGISQLMQGASGDSAKFGAALNATLLGVGVGLGAVALVKFFENLSDTGKQAFEDIGESSHGFIGNIEAAVGLIDTLNGKLESTADVTKRIQENFARQKLQMDYARADVRGTTAGQREERVLTRKEFVRDETIKRFEERGKDLEELKKSIGAASNLTDLYQKAGVTPKPDQDVEGYKTLFTKGALESPLVFFHQREKAKEELRQAIDVQIEQTHAAEADYSRSAGVNIQKENQQVVAVQQKDFWRGLEEKQFSSRISGRPDMLTEFLLHNNNATVGSTLDKLGVADPYNKSPEAAEKLLAPLFRGIESQAERLREDAMHPRLAPLAVAGTAEAYKQQTEYKAGAGAETVEERALTQAQIQTALLQQLNQTLASLTVHGGN